MSERSYPYVIIGGGLAGVSAIEGIREHDKTGKILLVGSEKNLPYDRPPLSKKLWLGKKKVEDIFLHDQDFYDQNNTTLRLNTTIVSLDQNLKKISDENGKTYYFEKLLLATGAGPRVLPVSGGDLSGICYYRYLDDYLLIRKNASEGKSAAIIGGGFIGSEMAAALNINKINVTMIFPEPCLLARVFPDYLGVAIQNHYIAKGVRILANERTKSISKSGNKYVIGTETGKSIEADLVIAGVGISPGIHLAVNAGLTAGNGVTVNEYLQTSHPDIYAAGDIAFFPYHALGQQMRLEHWDNALNQGKCAGQNMAGAHSPYHYMPYFFSDLFEFGFEAVGEVNAELSTFADWQKKNETGVIYYLKDKKVRGVMLCNVWEKLDAARELIKKNEERSAESLRGAIR
jgi:3-phenylpropionate/trans-cinnamate dioxygenase ferredoxin reductase subunit